MSVFKLCLKPMLIWAFI